METLVISSERASIQRCSFSFAYPYHPLKIYSKLKRACQTKTLAENKKRITERFNFLLSSIHFLFNSPIKFSISILYILQTSPSFKFSISNLAIGQVKQGKLYFVKISSAFGFFKISAKIEFLSIAIYLFYYISSINY